MTPTELKVFVRKLSLVPEHELDDDLLDIFLQEGYSKLERRRNWKHLLQPVETFTFTGNGWPLSNLTHSPVTGIAELVEGDPTRRPLTRITRSMVNVLFPTQSGASSRVYWVERDNLYVRPEATDVEFEILYYSIEPWDVAGDMEMPQVPEEYQTLTVGNYAVHRVWEQQEDLDKSDAYLGRFELAAGELEAHENRFSADGPKVHGQFATTRRVNANMPFLDGIPG